MYSVKQSKLINTRRNVNIIILDDPSKVKPDDIAKIAKSTDGLVGNVSSNEELNGSPIINVNNVKLHINLTKPLEKLRKELLGLQNEHQG